MPPPPELPSLRDLYRPRADVMGALASGACAVHCLVAALLAGFFPIALSGLSTGWLHEVFAVVVVLTSLVAFVPGWLRHGEARVWAWACSGLCLILYARWAGPDGFGELGDALATTTGGALLIVGHRLNHSLAYWCDRL